MTAIIGPNGAGKTTLFNVISGFRAPTRRPRRCSTDETSPDWRPEAIAQRGLVRTFQLVQLFENLTVLENVKVGRHLAHHGRALSARCCRIALRRDRAGVETLRASCCDKVGLDAHADTLAGVLPYGQKRLLEIARALAAEPKLLLLDEPAAGLNRGETTRLAELIRAIVDARRDRAADRARHELRDEHGGPGRGARFRQTDRAGHAAEVQKNPDVIAAYLGTMEAAHA